MARRVFSNYLVNEGQEDRVALLATSMKSYLLFHNDIYMPYSEHVVNLMA